MNRVLSLLASVCIAAAALGQEVPLMSPGDPRVRYVAYRADRSVVVKVRRGVVTRLVLERDEQIGLSAAGFTSRCEVESDEWCIRAMKGESQVWVKPRTGATHNNLELATNRRDYSIRFEVLEDAPRGQAAPDEVYRLIFVYPSKPDAAGSRASAETKEGPGASTGSALKGSVTANLAQYGCRVPHPVVNTAYSREAKPADLAPQRIFDDGLRTVFVFGDTASLPAVFAVAEDGSESRVNFNVDGNCLVVHQLGRAFVLRAGGSALKVFNDGFVVGAASLPARQLREEREVLP